MKREKNSEELPEHGPEASGTPPCSSVEIFSEKHLADFRHIDFHSLEFNTVDDLDDNIGNYRNFHSLDGIKTADMLHQEERKKKRHPENKIERNWTTEKILAEKRDSEIINTPDPLPLTIVSKGRTLIIGMDANHTLHCGELLAARGLTCTLYLVKNKNSAPPPMQDGNQCLMQADSIIVNGSFGCFYAIAADTDGKTKQVRRQGERSAPFDLVLDLQSVQAYYGKRLPMGYYAPGGDNARLEAALRELPKLKGRFTKPQFTVFRKDRCLYSLSRTNNCQRCLEICPVSAIRIEHGGIFIDQHLCQGCGSCALVCTSDAIHMINPSGQELAAGIRDLLLASLDDEISSPVLVIHPEDIPPVELNKISGNFGGRLILFGVDEIARIGPEIMLAALAYGAGAVVMALNGDTPAETIRALERRQRVCAAVLRGLEIQEDRISLLPPAGLSDSHDNFPYHALHKADSSSPITPVATFSPDCDKRMLFRLAVRHLYDLSAVDSPWITLPADEPFGAIVLDKSACTMCMSCAGVCPTGALSAGNDHPLLCFVETNCHQCGLCSEACPEGAVQLLPRIFCDDDKHQPPVVLHEAEPFNCIECGVPFAASAMIKHMEDKLAGHWMYSNDRQIRRLRMCRTCRTRDALLAKDFQR